MVSVESLFADLTEESIERTLGEEQLEEREYLKVRDNVIKLMAENSWPIIILSATNTHFYFLFTAL